MADKQKLVTISAQELQKKIQEEPEIILINVLEKKYHQDCHISGSINIPLDLIIEKTASWSKDKELIVYCASLSCPKSQEAYHILKDLGFEHVFNYQGGIKEWFQKGFEITGPCKSEYLHKH